MLATDGPFVWVNRDVPTIAFVEDNGQRPLVENTFAAAETAVVDAAIHAWNDRLVDVHNGQNRIELTITKRDISQYAAYGRTLITPGTPGQPIYADIQIDDDALSLGWFVDATPTLNEEFPVEQTPNYLKGNTAPGIDLLSVVTHEIAHAGGYSVFYETFFAHVSYNDNPQETANCSGSTPGGLRSVTKDGKTVAILDACPSTHFDLTAHPNDLLNEQVAHLAAGDRALISYRDLQILAQTFDYEVVDPRLVDIESQIADLLVERRDAATPEERAELTKQIRDLRKRAREIRGTDEPIIGPTPVIPDGPEITNLPPIITLASASTDVYARELVSFGQYVLDVSDPNGDDTIESIKVRTSGRFSESGYLLLDGKRLAAGVLHSLPYDPTNPNACFGDMQYVGAADARDEQVEISVSDGELETKTLLRLPTVGDSSITDDVQTSARDIGIVGTAWVHFRDDVGGIDYDGTQDAADYYLFTMGGGNVFEAKLTPAQAGVELQFQLLAADGSWLVDANEPDGLRSNASGRIASEPRPATNLNPAILAPVELEAAQQFLIRVSSSTTRSTYRLDIVGAKSDDWADEDLKNSFNKLSPQIRQVITDLSSTVDGVPRTTQSKELLTEIAIQAREPQTSLCFNLWNATCSYTATDVVDYVRNQSRISGVPEEIIAGVLETEVSLCDRGDWATDGSSALGTNGLGHSQGLGQVAPGTAAELSEFVWSELDEPARKQFVRLLMDDQVNIYYVGQYLKTLFEYFGDYDNKQRPPKGFVALPGESGQRVDDEPFAPIACPFEKWLFSLAAYNGGKGPNSLVLHAQVEARFRGLDPNQWTNVEDVLLDLKFWNADKGLWNGSEVETATGIANYVESASRRFRELSEEISTGATPSNVIFPVNGTDWDDVPGSHLHTETGGIGDADDRYAMDLNRPDGDDGETVYAIADGFVERNWGWGGTNYGQLLLKHFNPDGSVYYSGYLHMENITSLKSTQGAYVVAGTQIGIVSNVSKTPGLPNHLHFAIYEWDGTKLRSQPTTLVPAQARPSVTTVGDIILNGNPVKQSSVPVDRSSPFSLTATVKNTGSAPVHGNFYLILTRDATGSQYVGKVDELDACIQLPPSESSTLEFEKLSFSSPPGDYFLHIYFDDCSTGNVALKRVAGTNPISIYLRNVGVPAQYDVNSELNGYVPVSAQELDAAILAIRPDDNGLSGLGQVIVDVAQKHDINPYYIAAHAAWETGWGTSPIFLDKNNPFGYGAFDRCPYTCASSFKTLADGFEEAMAIIKEDYLTIGGRYYNGSTLAGMHVYYATDENWADGICQIMNSLQEN